MVVRLLGGSESSLAIHFGASPMTINWYESSYPRVLHWDLAVINAITLL